LRSIGYRVLTARNGEEAIQIHRKYQNDIDIIVLDIMMPNMGGGETYDRLKEINPEIRVLLSSGFGVDGEPSEILERSCDGFIQKPFTINELSEKLMEIFPGK
jgi:CheY-like chemotaxis protein